MSLLDDADFLESDLCGSLRERPLGFIDVGARGGVLPVANPVAPLTAVLAFEPDPSGIPELRASLGQGWRLAEVECAALGGGEGPATLHLYAHGVNHSLFPVNLAFRERYQVASLADRGTAQVEVETLDGVLYGRRAHEPFWGELLKLDVQGAELAILQAAPRTLAERTVAIICEVSFLDIYSGQPRFSEVERFLAAAGFTFYGFSHLQGWSRKFVDKRRAKGRERLCFGDAVFLRDPLPGSDGKAPATPRQRLALYLCALLLGYYDFAIELAVEGNLEPAEAERLIRVARRMAERGPAETIAEVEALLARMRERPEEAAIELGRFVDRNRTFWDVSDAALPRVPAIPRARRGQGA